MEIKWPKYRCHSCFLQEQVHYERLHFLPTVAREIQRAHSRLSPTCDKIDIEMQVGENWVKLIVMLEWAVEQSRKT